jgi:glycosyltransferase involved in cell wall biosynthesis
MDAIVPAHNEAPTIGSVVRALAASDIFGRVLVVNDGSTDATSRLAREAGAAVLDLHPNRGKAEAMLAGIGHSRGDVAFFDADLIGLRPDHAARLAQHFAAGFDQACGLRDYGLLNVAQTFGPVITGERFVRRWVLDEVPSTCWRGYAIETVINFIVDAAGGSTCLVPMDGVRVVHKAAPWTGQLAPLIRRLQHARTISAAERSLRQSGGTLCDVK